MIVIKSYPFKAADKKEKYFKFFYENTKDSFDKYWQMMHQRLAKKTPNY